MRHARTAFMIVFLAIGSAAAQGQAQPGAVDQAIQQGTAAAGAVTEVIKDPGKAGAELAQDIGNVVAPEVGQAAKDIAAGLANIASGGVISSVLGSALGGLERGLIDLVTENNALKQRVTVLEQENAKKDVEIAHSKAEYTRLTQQMAQINDGLAQIKATQEQQLGALQARIDALERNKGTVPIPFKVVDKSGYPLLLIDDQSATFSIPGGGGRTDIALKSGAQPQIYLGNQQGGVSIEAGSANRLLLQSGETALFELRQDAGAGTSMTGKSTEGSFELGSGPSLVGLMVKKGDQPAAGLGTFEGRGVALRVFAASGQTVGAMGENPGTPGTGIVYVGNGSQNAAALSANTDGSGVVHAFAADGTVGAGLVGLDRMVAAYNAAGFAVVTIGKSENSEGGNVTSRDPSGEGVFRAGDNGAVTGGDACVYRAKKQNVFCLGIGAPGMGAGRF